MAHDPPHPDLPDLADARLRDRLCGELHDDRLLAGALLEYAMSNLSFFMLLWREQIAPRLRPRTIGQLRRWCLYALAIFWVMVIWWGFRP